MNTPTQLGSRFAIPLYSFIVLLLFAACSRAPESNVSRYAVSDCPLEVNDAQQVQCAFFNVPERHEHPGGKEIQIAAAQFKSANPRAASSPLVLLNGGPGDSNFEMFFPVLASPLGEALLSHGDVVIIESRGLYHSKPNLVAEEVFAAQLEMVGKNIKGPEANRKFVEAIHRAHARFVEEGIDLPAFNNRETAADIAAVLTALGYDRFNLFGTSAGTMVAQEVMRNHPDRLRAVILNAAVPGGSALFEQMFGNAARSLSQYFAMCEADEACASAYPQAEQRFLSALARLNASPKEISVTDPATRQEVSLVLNGDKVSSWIFVSMYWNTQIIQSIDRIAKGDFTEIRNAPDIFFPMSRFAYSLGYTAAIAENPDFAANDGALPDGYEVFTNGLALFFSPRLIEATRNLWQDAAAPTASSKLVSDVPTLVMNGALDHVIPRQSLDQLASGLRNGYVFIFDGVAHSPVDAGECGLAMMMAFLADPSTAPNSECVADYRHTFALPE
jgi:pimeloyl-ACP methyl ester carboxylesterase